MLCVYFPSFTRFLSNAGGREGHSDVPGGVGRPLPGTWQDETISGWAGRSAHELGAQIWDAEAGIDVGLTHTAALLLLAPALLPGAAALTNGRRLQIVEVERSTVTAKLIAATWPTATHLQHMASLTVVNIDNDTFFPANASRTVHTLLVTALLFPSPDFHSQWLTEHDTTRCPTKESLKNRRPMHWCLIV